MGEAEGVVKHIILTKFKDEIPPERIEELIKDYASLVDLIPPMKAFRWGKDLRIGNLNEGFTHIFESTFESVEGVAEFLDHPAHVEFAKQIDPCTEKKIGVDYKPTTVPL